MEIKPLFLKFDWWEGLRFQIDFCWFRWLQFEFSRQRGCDIIIGNRLKDSYREEVKVVLKLKRGQVEVAAIVKKPITFKGSVQGVIYTKMKNGES